MAVDKLLKLYKEVTENKKIPETKEKPAKIKNYKSYEENYKRNHNLKKISKFQSAVLNVVHNK